MRIALFDDSIEFDGYLPDSFPLGGAEKAFASLASALAGRGHDVSVYNRCSYALTIEGASWKTWDGRRPLETDVLIAFRRPSLLLEVRKAAHRVLWVTAPPEYLDKPAARKLLASVEPTVVLIGATQAARWHGPKVPTAVIEPGVRTPYLAEGAALTADTPTAVTTTHPRHGLDWLLDLWVERIHPAVPKAELHVYSALLARSRVGGDVPEEFRPLLAKAEAAVEKGVRIREPLGDNAMSLAYRAARVHLYPGHRDDMACWTLAESQACGLPAVARPVGAVHERVVNGQTGYIVPDDEAFANVTVQILTDDGVFQGLSKVAGAFERKRTWDMAAAAFEALWSGDGT